MNPLLCENRTLWLPHSGQDFTFLMNCPRRPALILTNWFSRLSTLGNGTWGKNLVTAVLENETALKT
jgi:hypothetical protein